MGTISPPLKWSNAPVGTQEFALICSDLDASLPYGFTHWVMYSIPSDVTGIGEGEGKKSFTEVTTDYGEQGYGGPDPPPENGPHHLLLLAVRS